MEIKMLRALRSPFIYHLAAAVLVLSLPGLRLGKPPWWYGSQELMLFGALAILYVIGALLFMFLARTPSRGWLDAAIIAFATFGLAALFIVAVDYQISRIAFLAAVACGIGSLVAFAMLPRLRALLTPLIGVVIAVALLVPVLTDIQIRPETPMYRSDKTKSTSLYAVKMTTFHNVVPPVQTFFAGGSIAELGAGYLIATGDGELYQIELPEDDISLPRVKDLELRIPFDRSAFSKATKGSAVAEWFRVLDVAAHETADGVRLLASYHWWNETEACIAVRVSSLETSHDGVASASEDEWKTVFETTPCLGLEDPEWPFRGMEGGGKILPLDEAAFLLTIGDHGFNGVDFETDYVSDPKASYGKTFKVSLGGDGAELFTAGHRNPQGLFLDSDGNIWETEHGPQGGDELNLLNAGGNYGWPQVSYGTDYGDFKWPRSSQQQRHAGATLPIYSWVPSIAVSSVVRMENGLFSQWKDDIIVGSLTGQKLVRVRLEDERVAFAEPIEIGDRIRDMIEDESGQLVLWSDSRSLIVLRPLVGVPAEDRSKPHS